MLGYLRGIKEKFNIYRYPHKYEDPTKIFDARKESYHFYDLCVFIIITTFLGVFAYTMMYEGQEKGYMILCVTILGICTVMY